MLDRHGLVDRRGRTRRRAQGTGVITENSVRFSTSILDGTLIADLVDAHWVRCCKHFGV